MKRAIIVRLFYVSMVVCAVIISNTIIIAQSNSGKSIPNKISFEGILLDEGGGQLSDGIYDFTFYLYDTPEGGKAIWQETQKDINVINKTFHVVLGENDPLNIPINMKHFLSIQINGEEETQNRIELESTPYSLGAKLAQEVNDTTITTEKFADLSVTDDKIESVSWEKLTDVDPDPYSIYWTITGNILYGPERNYIGTIERKDFVLKTFSKQRMKFDPYGHVLIGTPEDSVDFEVIGKTIFCDVYIKGRLGIGVDPALAKVHVKSQNKQPFRVDYQGTEKFSIDTKGRVVINSDVDGPDDDVANYPLFVDSEDQGIAIRVDGGGLLGEANSYNDFVSFWDEFLEGRTGKIEGENLLDHTTDPRFIAAGVYYTAVTAAEIVAAAGGPLNAASLVAYGAELVEAAVIAAYEVATLGVTYESGFMDYAEWLERLDHSEILLRGDIVGVYGGKISKSTIGAEQLLCISTAPIVLGNMPKKGQESFYEKTAFLGQVPVKVFGKVNEGDFIIPSGLEDGVGIALSPELMTIADFGKIVGRAWESSDNELLKYVNTAVGFEAREMVEVLKIKQKRNQLLKQKLSEKESKIKIAINELAQLQSLLSDMKINVTSIAKEMEKQNKSQTKFTDILEK